MASCGELELNCIIGNDNALALYRGVLFYKSIYNLSIEEILCFRLLGSKSDKDAKLLNMCVAKYTIKGFTIFSRLPCHQHKLN